MQVEEKERLERELAELKDNQTNPKSTLTPEQFMETLGEEQDLSKMSHFC